MQKILYSFKTVRDFGLYYLAKIRKAEKKEERELLKTIAKNRRYQKKLESSPSAPPKKSKILNIFAKN